MEVSLVSRASPASLPGDHGYDDSRMQTGFEQAPLRLDPSAISSAYEAERAALAVDPLFITNAAAFGVSLEALDRQMQRPPGELSGEALVFWLSGPDQYRYAGLRVLRRALGGGAASELSGTVVVPDGALWLARGDVRLDGALHLGNQAMVVVLGALHVSGAIVTAEYDYSLLAAHSLACRAGFSSGEVLATERIEATEWFYFAGNDYSARAPRFEGPLLVDFERSNVFTEVQVGRRLTAWDFDAAALALGVEPGGGLARSVRAKLRAS